MSLIHQNLESAGPAGVGPVDVGSAAAVQTAYGDNQAFKAVMSQRAAAPTDGKFGNVTLMDGPSCKEPRGLWSRFVESLGNGMVAESYALGGPVPPQDMTLPDCKIGGAASAGPAQGRARDARPILVPQPDAPGKAPDARPMLIPQPDAPGKALDARPMLTPQPDAPGKAPGASLMLRSEIYAPEKAPDFHTLVPPGGDAKSGPAPLILHLGELPIPGQGPLPAERPSAGDGPATPKVDQPVAPAPGQDKLNPLLPGVLNNIGKHVTELENGINPRLGCVRMVSHAMHEADPSFPETNNAAAFRKALKDHGYEEVTLKPGDPALKQGHAGDVLVGRRPDGMPSHAAINMGDGTVFNNNSDSGKGEIGRLDQFNQGMHDSKGHWMKNGFSEVTIFRKKVDAGKVSTTGDTSTSV